ncbi:MAG: bifunctional phosphoribosylaminoimidazolecarboxamide formyltransferase/IMP cyclohydrolase [Verrucomicrobiota bacterium]
MARALLSVSDKTGLIPFAEILVKQGVSLVSTGGTAKSLRDAGLPVTEISDFTGFPEMMDGRVKTLHPKVHGGLLYVRGNAEHEAQAKAHGIEPIDFVIVNLYPFEETIKKPGVSHETCIENIDIGGPSMLRSASKNYRSVTVLVDPSDYTVVAEQIQKNGSTTLELRETLAMKVFQHTSYYDSLIGNYLLKRQASEEFPEQMTLGLRKAQGLRYGENPHQKAILYGDFHQNFEQIHGKELSYNNILDISGAVDLIREFSEEPTIAILKHTNPCGVGSGATLKVAWDRAYATDRQAPFGGIIVANQVLDGATAEAISEIFSEVIIAPEFSAEALEILTKKKNLRLMINKLKAPSPFQIRSAAGNSWLIQQTDSHAIDSTTWKVVTKRAPSLEEKAALLFAWRVVRHVKSNAIVYSASHQTLGVGAGQMSRVDSSKVAVWKAGEAKLSLKGSVIASDAFFPFADGLIAAGEAGVTAAIQPGGSVRDAEVIAAADERGIAMVFTGLRHFKH